MVQHPTFPFLLLTVSFKASDQGRDRLIKTGILLIRGMMMVDGELGINTCRLSDQRVGWMDRWREGRLEKKREMIHLWKLIRERKREIPS